MIEINRIELNKYLFLLKGIFDIVRVIEPTSKEILHYEGGDNIIHNHTCYKFWGKMDFCKDCVSNRAMVEGRTTIKTEYNGDGIYLVMASPIKVGDKLYIFEMIKNITETELVKDLNGKISDETISIISTLSRKIVTDDLTGVYNRRYINERLQRDIDDVIKSKEKFSIIMLDIDYFKDINDIYGHLAGDLVLRTLANIISANIRKGYDWVARYGGDEFIIFLKNADSKTANNIIKEIQFDFKYSNIRFDNYLIQTTISFGSYTHNGNLGNMDDILNMVDINLNMAKKSGRNMIISS